MGENVDTAFARSHCRTAGVSEKAEEPVSLQLLDYRNTRLFAPLE